MQHHDSRHFLDSLKARYQLPSDYAASKLLGVTKESLSLIRNGKTAFGPESALKIADLLGLPRGYVIACCEAERAKTEALKSTWLEMAKSALGCILLTLAAAVTPGSGTANAAGTGTGENTHYAKNKGRRKNGDRPCFDDPITVIG